VPFIDIAPHWGVDAVFLPDGTVCETDFAADGTFAPRFSLRPDRRRDVVSVLNSEGGIGFGEGVELPTRPEDLKHLFGDIVKVHVPPVSSLFW
jgi:hypothetical protein